MLQIEQKSLSNIPQYELLIFFTQKAIVMLAVGNYWQETPCHSIYMGTMKYTSFHFHVQSSKSLWYIENIMHWYKLKSIFYSYNMLISVFINYMKITNERYFLCLSLYVPFVSKCTNYRRYFGRHLRRL